jgi:drug/metabolite transporter (DMT)-like permease
MSPAVVAWGRVATGAVVLVALTAPRGLLRGIGESVGVVVLVAAVGVAGPFFLIAVGQQEISSSLAGILVSSAPLFTALLAGWVDHEERSTGKRLVGVTLGFAGVVILLGVDLSGSGAALLGGLAVVLAGLGYAVSGFIVKRRTVAIPPLGMAAGVMLASTVLLAPAAALSLPSEVSAGPIAAVLALGAVGTGIAYAVFYSLISWVGPARTFVVTYIAPGFALVYGVTLLDEALTFGGLAGLALIVGGSVLAVGERGEGEGEGAPAASAEPVTQQAG